MDRVHAQIAHDADLAAGPDLTLPIGRLGRIEIAAMVETGTDFEQLAKAAPARNLVSALRSREKREIPSCSERSDPEDLAALAIVASSL